MTGNPASTAFRFAWRESRAAFKNFKIFIASLFLGTAIIAGVGSVTSNISNSIEEDGRTFLGGDVQISLTQKRLTPEERIFLEKRGELSEIATLRSMAHTTDKSSLVDLKGVDTHYPLYGELELEQGDYGPLMLGKQGGRWGIILSEPLATRLGISLDEDVKLGTKLYQVRGLIKKEPDANNQGLQLAPGAIVALDSLFDNTLIKPGSLVRYHTRIRLFDGVALETFRDELKESFPDQAWRVRDHNSGGSSLRRFVSRMGQFMTLVGLTALLVGGVGVSNGVRTYLESKTDTIATYKILGATSRTILLIYLGQIMLIAAFAIMAGLLVGGLLPLMFGDILKNSLQVDLEMSLQIKPLILAALYSGAIAAVFTLWPLGKAVQTPAARLFRQTVTPKGRIRQSLPYIVTIGGIGLCLLTLVVYTSQFKAITAALLAGTAVAFVILYGAASLAKWLAKRLPRPHNPIFRIAISNMYRPGNATNSIVLSLGLGLILFTAVALIENNMIREINDRVKGDAASFFFIDVQKSQKEVFTRYFEEREGVESYRMVPNLRGRVTQVKGVPSKDVKAKPEGRWILRGDRGISFSAAPPPNNKIVAGKWWPEDYTGAPRVSISKQMADAMDLKVNDEITLNILGRDFTLPIMSIRDFDWESFDINYVMIVDPNTLANAPFTYVGTAKTVADQEPEIYRELTGRFPSVSLIRTKDVLGSALEIMAKIATAIDFMAAITIMSGILVLAGAISAGHRTRIYDAAVLKIVGATRLDILKAYIIEFILLGLLTGGIAILLGTVAAYSVIVFVMEMTWLLPVYIPVNTVGVSILATLAFGIVSIWLAMSARPAQVLRNA
ncbi:ABC transporter permease [Paremcibacter congregatus]|uniref:ABC transporter permease n=1 Tax=Paremcibacter congregatus TaxID=2043170 RepID=UPI0030ECF2F9|tara:strand:+ start:8295 stop:10820 length:2526 start_codon:yes stop_codon:yes gene_type:complete